MSQTSKTNFAEIKINTMTYVAYDKQEGAGIVCELFFDSGDCNGVVILKGMSTVESDWEMT